MMVKHKRTSQQYKALILQGILSLKKALTPCLELEINLLPFYKGKKKTRML